MKHKETEDMLRLVKMYFLSKNNYTSYDHAILIIFTNLAKFQAKLVYDHIAEKDSPAENCIAICISKNT